MEVWGTKEAAVDQYNQFKVHDHKCVCEHFNSRNAMHVVAAKCTEFLL